MIGGRRFLCRWIQRPALARISKDHLCVSRQGCGFHKKVQ